MLLADASVWIGHFRGVQPELGPLLDDGSVLMHPFVPGELACGNLKQRETVLGYLDPLPSAAVAHHTEALRVIAAWKLHGRGIGWMDSHMIASRALLSHCAANHAYVIIPGSSRLQ
jgi:predicted nucleic acid-binding protein